MSCLRWSYEEAVTLLNMSVLLVIVNHREAAQHSGTQELPCYYHLSGELLV